MQSLLANGPKKSLDWSNCFTLNFSIFKIFSSKNVGTKVHFPMGQRSHDWLEFFLHTLFSSTIYGDLLVEMKKVKK
jgi:hypothetical protein